jgi:dienelactone hydrolase
MADKSSAAAGSQVGAGGASAPSSIPLPADEQIYDSNVGSLYGPISRIRDDYEWASESFAQERFKAGDHAQWRKRALAIVQDSLHYRPAKTDFAVKIVEEVDCGEFTRQKLYFNTTPELRVPAYVLVPKNLKGKAPAIMAMHDHGGFYRWGKEKLVHVDGENPVITGYRAGYAGRSIADDLARAGYVVMVIDLLFWGERRMRTPNDPPTGPGETAEAVNKFNAAADEQLVARTIYGAGYTWSGVNIWDDIRSLDYLLTRPEVDPQRIGTVGWSLGGWRAAHLAAMDERVKAAVDVCWLSSFKDIQRRNTIWTLGFTTIMPGLYRKLDMPDVVSLAAPRALLCINGHGDTLFPVKTGVEPAYKTLETVYAKLGAGDKFRGHLYDTPHEFNADMQKEAWAWFAKWLK